MLRDSSQSSFEQFPSDVYLKSDQEEAKELGSPHEVKSYLNKFIINSKKPVDGISPSPSAIFSKFCEVDDGHQGTKQEELLRTENGQLLDSFLTVNDHNQLSSLKKTQQVGNYIQTRLSKLVMNECANSLNLEQTGFVGIGLNSQLSAGSRLKRGSINTGGTNSGTDEPLWTLSEEEQEDSNLMSFPETSKPYSGKQEARQPGSSSSNLARKHNQLPSMQSASQLARDFNDQSISSNSAFMQSALLESQIKEEAKQT